MRSIACIVGLVCLGTVGVCLAAGRVPWQRRVASPVEIRHNLAKENVTVEMWPAEPETPPALDPVLFQGAFSTLCGPMPEDRLDKYVEVLLTRGAEFDVDPFLLGALVYDRSGCRPRTPDREVTHGVTRIDVKMHAPHIRSGEYRYYLREGADWKKEVLEVSEYPFNKWKAEKIPSNIYWAAALMKVFSAQCGDLDKALGGVPHRHPVSHWFYGDKVKSAAPEDVVLTARRRLLAYYHSVVPEAAGNCRGVGLVSPLDGTPRLVLDYFGNPRGKKGGVGHRGIDLDGITGEPVRAIASGRVSFAGVDIRGKGSRPLTPDQATALERKAMGPGGLFVKINHGDGFGSIYMHLDSLSVTSGDEVKAGQIIGTLGRTGTEESGPHLHLEIRQGTGRVDPAVVLKDVLVDPFGGR